MPPAAPNGPGAPDEDEGRSGDDPGDGCYFATVEVSDDQEPAPQPEEVRAGPCSVCATVGPRRRWMISQDPRAKEVFAGTWLLCGVCDALAESGDEAGLADRLRPGDLTVDQAHLLARLLTEARRG